MGPSFDIYRVCNNPKDLLEMTLRKNPSYTANILTVLSTAFVGVKFVTVIRLHILQQKTAINFKLDISKCYV